MCRRGWRFFLGFWDTFGRGVSFVFFVRFSRDFGFCGLEVWVSRLLGLAGSGEGRVGNSGVRVE